MSGWLSRFRIADESRVVGPAVSDAATGLYAATAVLGALYERAKSGVGRTIDISMIEATMALAAEPIGQFLATGSVPPVLGRGAMSQAYIVTCADGLRIGLHLSSPDKFWDGICRALGRPDWIEQFSGRMNRVRRYEEIASELNAAFLQRPRAEWLPLLQAEDVPFAPEHQLDELESDPQIAHLAPFYELGHPSRGVVRGLHRPYRVDGMRSQRLRPPPELGQHNDEIATEFGLTGRG